MTKEQDILRRIQSLPEPRHLFILPEWADPAALDALIRGGQLNCQYQQRNERGDLLVVMGLNVTPKGEKLLDPKPNVPKLVWKGSLAGVSFVTMSLLILYLG